MRTEVSIEAPCKINVHLRIKGRRSDGFHELESIFLALAFGDTLHFKLRDTGSGDEFLLEDKRPAFTGRFWSSPPQEELPRGNNIVLKALGLFRAKTGFARPLRIGLEKRIPLGAGLGGGSSDGAATLLALNELAGAPLSGEQLWELGAALGSDVPFFLGGSSGVPPCGAAFVTGRGERIRPIAGPPKLPVLLVNPGFPSNTAEAFRLLDAQGDAQGIELAGEAPSPEALIGALKAPPSLWPYRNDFLPVFLAGGKPEVQDAYRAILNGLKAQGADFCGLTGSGSTCFGIFTKGGTAEQAAKSLAGLGYLTFLSFPLRV
jgi:4-diphosphocytidyl-2-C-methyl-D-erythritol kinase